MKKTMMVAIALIASMVCVAQTKKTTLPPSLLKKQMEFKVLNGLDEWVKIPVKVLNPKEIDSSFGKKSSDIVEWAVLMASSDLKFSMTNRYSYKPLSSSVNTITFLNDGNKFTFAVDLLIQAKNGYGNDLQKKYTVFYDYDNTKEVSESLQLITIM